MLDHVGVVQVSAVELSDVELCAGRLDAELDRLLEAEHERRDSLSMPSVVDALAVEIAAKSGRPLEVVRRVLTLIARRELGEVVELVECRRDDCMVSRVTLLSYVGVGCGTCGGPLARVVGPAGDVPCPSWCAEHPEQHEDLFTHARPLLDRPAVSVWLEASTSYDAGADRLEETGAVLVVNDAEDTIRVRADAGTLDALLGAVRAAQRLLGDVS